MADPITFRSTILRKRETKLADNVKLITLFYLFSILINLSPSQHIKIGIKPTPA